MTVIVRAHFDGQVLVPEERPDLPVNQPLTVHIEVPMSAANDVSAKLAALDRIVARAVNANLPAEALSRETIYEDRP